MRGAGERSRVRFPAFRVVASRSDDILTISSGGEALRERRERRSDGLSHRFGGADVLLGHLEGAGSGALLVEGVVASDSHPREARSAQVVEA